MAEERTHIAVGIVCVGSKVLLIERKQREVGSDGNQIVWAFPGGKVDRGETAWQAAAREVFEETGTSVIPVRTITEENHPHYPVFISYISCTFVSATAEAPPQDPAITKSTWVPLDELRNYLRNHMNEKVAAYLDELT